VVITAMVITDITLKTIAMTMATVTENKHAIVFVDLNFLMSV
jgi:hypothetical protein